MGEKADKVSICWLGHSCFLIEKDRFRVILDPYEDQSVGGYGPLRVDADLVLCSHEHGDHHGTQCIRTRSDTSEKTNPFVITEIQSWHDEANGKKRGPNTIRILNDGNYRIAHMGDIGCYPEERQIELLKDLDVCLVPVGGFFTLNPDKVFHLMNRIRPRIVVPMHYRFKRGRTLYGMRVIAKVDHYLKKCDNVQHCRRNYLVLPDDLPADTKTQTFVLELGQTQNL